MTEFIYDAYDAPPQAPVVHWMERRPLGVGPTALSVALLGAALLGAGVALAAMAAVRVLDER